MPDERAEQGGGTGGGGKADTLRQRRDGKDGELPQDGLGAGQGEGWLLPEQECQVLCRAKRPEVERFSPQAVRHIVEYLGEP